MLVAQFQNEPPEIKAAIIEDSGQNKAAVEASITALVKQIRTGTIEIKAASLRVLGKAGDAALAKGDAATLLPLQTKIKETAAAQHFAGIAII
jgi:hypothetical protein